MERVAVLRASPIFRAGVVAALREVDLPIEEPEDPSAWARAADGVGLVEVRSSADWRFLTAVASETKAELIALLPEVTVEGYRKALRAGASSVFGLGSEPAALIQVTTAALRGDALLPAPLLRSLVLDPPVLVLSDDEHVLLRAIASTDKVAGLASQAGHSRRTQTRRLQRLYKRLGVANRQEAVDWYRRHFPDEDDRAGDG